PFRCITPGLRRDQGLLVSGDVVEERLLHLCRRVCSLDRLQSPKVVFATSKAWRQLLRLGPRVPKILFDKANMLLANQIDEAVNAETAGDHHAREEGDLPSFRFQEGAHET